jgi:hypothetical protein
MKEYDVVRLNQDLPELGLSRGLQGTIVMAFNEPGKIPAFEVEFVDQDGKTIAVKPIRGEYLDKIWEA